MEFKITLEMTGEQLREHALQTIFAEQMEKNTPCDGIYPTSFSEFKSNFDAMIDILNPSKAKSIEEIQSLYNGKVKQWAEHKGATLLFYMLTTNEPKAISTSVYKIWSDEITRETFKDKMFTEMASEIMPRFVKE
jgi:hypothetical protein